MDYRTCFRFTIWLSAVFLISCSEAVPNVNTLSQTFNGFVKINSPNAPILASSSTPITIDWETVSQDISPNPVDIEYSADSGVSWSNIGSSLPATGSMVWNPPIITVPEVLIRVNARENSGAYVSNSVGQIELDNTPPTVVLQNFTGGQLVAGNSPQTLLYTASDAHMGLVDIYSSSDSGSNWNLLQLNVMNTGSASITIPANDLATNRFRVIAKDILGNSMNADGGDFTIDSTAPAVTVTAPVGGEAVAGGQTLTINYAASDLHLLATPISIDYSMDNGTTWLPIITNAVNAMSYVWTTPALNSAAMKVRVRALDTVALQGTTESNGNFIVDSTSPSFLLNQMTINNGNANSPNAIAPVGIGVADTLTPVTHFCLKLDSLIAPTVNDSCWVQASTPPLNLAPSLNLAVTGYSFNFGYFNSTHTLYAWARDKVGNISSLSNASTGTNSRDRADVTISIDVPPTLNNVIVANTSSHSDPPSDSEKTVSTGATVFVKWAANDSSFGANPIRLDYTLDDGATFTLIANNLANAQNGSCVINAALPASDDNMTGCYAWTLPSFGGGQSPRVRVTATDSSSQSQSFLSQALNSSMSLIAGRLDSGIGGDARRAIFTPDLSDEYEGDPDIFAVKANGDMFFRDRVRGLIYIPASTRIAQLIVPTNGAMAGDGGPVTNASFRFPLKIAIDGNGDLLVFDYDRIRKIVTSTNPMTISTLIGGGADLSDTVANPLNVLIEAPLTVNSSAARYMPFFVLPNGRIYFQSQKFGYQTTQGAGARIRYFDPTDGMVKTLAYSGLGTGTNSATDLSQCAFKSFNVAYDPNTSAETKRVLWTNYVGSACLGAGFSSLDSAGVSTAPHPINPTGQTHYGYMKSAQDGGLYYTSKYYARVYKYNLATNAWSVVAGTGTAGSCLDGVDAGSCNIRVHDIAVTRQGQVFLVDSGRIRTIDSGNRIRTVYGTALDQVDENVFATAAYVGPFDTFGLTTAGEFKILDKGARRFRSVSTTGFIKTLAGNGIYSGSVITQGLGTSSSLPLQTNIYPNFAMNPTTGDIYYGDEQYILRLDSSGNWSRVVGGGATSWESADGVIGSNIALTTNGANTHRVIGMSDSNILVAKNRYVGNYVDASIKSYVTSLNYQQTHFAGVSGAAGSTFGTDELLRQSYAVPISVYTNYYSNVQEDISDLYMMVPGTTRIVQVPKSQFILTSTLKFLAEGAKSFYVDTANSRIFFCNTIGQLRSTPITGSSVTNHPLPAGTSCTGTTLIYTNGSLYVPITKDRITYGLLKYKIP